MSDLTAIMEMERTLREELDDMEQTAEPTRRTLEQTVGAKWLCVLDMLRSGNFTVGEVCEQLFGYEVGAAEYEALAINVGMNLTQWVRARGWEEINARSQ